MEYVARLGLLGKPLSLIIPDLPLMALP